MAIEEAGRPLAGITGPGGARLRPRAHLVLISAYRADRTEAENEARQARLSARLWRCGLRPEAWRGSWEGVEESTLAVVAPNTGALAHLRALGAAYHQQCVLAVDLADRRAYLVSCDDGEPDQLTPLGEWRHVSEAEARAGAGWTRDGAGAYWVAT